MDRGYKFPHIQLTCQTEEKISSNAICTPGAALIILHPSKKVTQHEFDRLYFFYPGFLFIRFDIPIESLFIAFRMMPYLLGLFHWGACRLSNLGVKSKRNTKLIRLYGKCSAMPSFELYARVPTAHSLRRNPPKHRRTEWAVGTHACIEFTKGKRKYAFPI